MTSPARSVAITPYQTSSPSLRASLSIVSPRAFSPMRFNSSRRSSTDAAKAGAYRIVARTARNAMVKRSAIVPIRSVGQMLDAAEKFVPRLARPDGDEPCGLTAVVDVAVDDHRWHADQIAALPWMLRSFVNIVASAVDDEQKLLEDVAMLAAVRSGHDFLRHDVHPARWDI